MLVDCLIFHTMTSFPNIPFDSALDIDELALDTGGTILVGSDRGPSVPTGARRPAKPPAVCTDSRDVARGGVFFALKGEKTDGHRYLAQVCEHHPAAIVIHDRAALASLTDCQRGDIAIIFVTNTGAALLSYAAAYRRRLCAEVFAVGGSNGKTTTCRLLSSILSSGFRGNASRKSYNNSVGVPLTILATPPDSEYLICEVGTNAKGEIAPLIKTVAPTCSVITSIGREHLEGFGTLEGVIEEELMMLVTGVEAVIPADEPSLVPLAVRKVGSRNKITTFGFAPSADARIIDCETSLDETRFSLVTAGSTSRFSVPLPGKHNASNAAAAIIAGRRLGLHDFTIAAALARATAPDMRMQQVSIAGIHFINDAYNANPDSALAAITTFASIFGPTSGRLSADAADMRAGGRRVLIFGDMLELGDLAQGLHDEVIAAAIAASCFELLVLVGRHASRSVINLDIARLNQLAVTFPDAQAAAAAVHSILKPGDNVLLKGSRGTGIEKILKPFELMQAERADG